MHQSDEELVALYLAGDESAYNELVERHLKTVYSFVVRFVGNAQDAEDIVQETFVKAWKHAKRYRSEASSFKTWVMRIARNSAIDHLRKRKALTFSQFDTPEGVNILAETLADAAPLPEELFMKKEDSEHLSEALQKLPAGIRDILLLHYDSGLTFLEIGELLGEPQNTIKSRHYRAMGALRKLLANQSAKGTKPPERLVYE